MENNHGQFMQRCLQLAEAGLRAAMPNPSVGAVLVHNGRIIGEGFTSPYGGPHGEVNCLNSVKPQDASLIPDSVLYVSLEPCSHFGKTPPCSDLIIRHKIRTVVIGATDPNPLVAGRGIEKLQAAGCTVTTGVLEDECCEMNRRFFTFHEKKRPYIILKWAKSADGFIAPNRNMAEVDLQNLKPVWITNKYSRQIVHKWRSEEAATLIGTQTVMDDNPSLDVRDWTGADPVRVVLDRTGRITSDFSVKNQKIKTIILTEQQGLTNLENLIYEQVNFDESLAANVLDVLHRHNLLSVIIEGGSRTLETFITAGLWDEARIFTGPAYLYDGVKSPVIIGDIVSSATIKEDKLTILKRHG
ncbi:MAG: bifunctional diaminohydroxyphosphoribosylaminopyrimidine deaminase/5-amino-6-(5-phosphoribosylamino)uracil reductase RibD [Flavobacterium sp.]